ncbi:MAG: hypothetical protein CTY35_03315 [Methylotenera sp.]|jgi:hypothetical protein|uniref:hypothetical protein n=1 Tax=Methylotenera TaxID=359407 RepID=UPI0003648AA8|nr:MULTISPECIES: hypothetical protein [Methylotenera]MDP3777573.1 hypothetical protein [Methylotenera sp.]PPC96346.1 MAG: hypothetical protein CTY32_05825 [Methylotenera sp.]PPD00009.1 MAG: hypothetical protein CTY35_03315 [Methylotenera sp.]
MKNIVTVILTTSIISVSANAAEVTADTNLAIGANTILANFKRLTEVPVAETPSVDKSLAIGVNNILGNFKRLTQVELDRQAINSAPENEYMKALLKQVPSK